MKATFEYKELAELIEIGIERLTKLKHLKNIALLKEEHDKQYRIDEYEKLGFFRKILADDPRRPSLTTWYHFRIHSESIQYGLKITNLESLICSLQKAKELGTHEVSLTNDELLMLELEKQYV